MRRPHHGGQNARDWRRKIAALAAKQGESVSTYKFLLDMEEGDIDFATAARAYDIAEGIERGSLIGLLCAVHLSGFRVFSSGGEARRFRNGVRYPAADFARALKAHAGIGNGNVTIQSIEGAFSSPRRSQDGVPPSWSQYDLAVRLFREWSNRRSPSDGERDEAEFGLAKGIAAAVCRCFGSWKELAGDVAGALARADDYLQSLGAFPKLDRLPPEAVVRPRNCTLAYDPDSPFIDMEEGSEDIWLHRVVSVCLGRMRRDGLDPSSRGFDKKLKHSVVTVSNNGLSWLFGTGLRYFRENAVEAIAEDLCVPEPERRRVEQLKVFADAVPPNPFFDVDSYAEFRASVGGKVSSWVSNYRKRLDELDGLHTKPQKIDVPEALRKPETPRCSPVSIRMQPALRRSRRNLPGG